MAMHPLELEIAAEELLVLQFYMTGLAAQVTTGLSELAEDSDVTTIAAAKVAYDAARNAYASYGNIRLPAVVNSGIFTRIAAEAAA